MLIHHIDAFIADFTIYTVALKHPVNNMSGYKSQIKAVLLSVTKMDEWHKINIAV